MDCRGQGPQDMPAGFNIKNLQGEGVKILFWTKSSNYIMLPLEVKKLRSNDQNKVRNVKPILH